MALVGVEESLALALFFYSTEKVLFASVTLTIPSAVMYEVTKQGAGRVLRHLVTREPIATANSRSMFDTES